MSNPGGATPGISLSNAVHSEVAPCLPLPSLPVFCGAIDQDLRLSDDSSGLRSLNRKYVLSQAGKIANLLQATDVSYFDDELLVDWRNQGKLIQFHQENLCKQSYIINLYMNEKVHVMCWVASVITTIESIYAISNPNEEFTPLSHLEIVNCFEVRYPNVVPNTDEKSEFDEMRYFGGNDFRVYWYAMDHGISLVVDCP